MRRSRVFCLLAFAAAAGAAGCASGSRFGDVQGEVTLDGQPLAEGVVRFVPADGKTPTASALVEGGRFRERVPVGNHRVEISSPKLPKGVTSSGQMKRGTVDEGAALEELIPERYNARTELTTEVKKGTNKVRFDLKSK
jgi:hypothetical protein